MEYFKGASDVQGDMMSMLDFRYWRCVMKREWKCPDSEINFYLYTPERPYNQWINVKHVHLLPKLGWKLTRKNVFIVHGFNGTHSKTPMTFLRDAYLWRKDYNVFMVDWSNLSRFPCYLPALANMRLAAQCTAQLYSYLTQNGAKAKMITCVGHSLGAHICGMMSGHLTKKQYKIIVSKSVPHPPNTAEDVSQNSDMGDTKSSDNGESKSLSPPTSASEVSADLDIRVKEQPLNDIKMEVDSEVKLKLDCEVAVKKMEEEVTEPMELLKTEQELPKESKTEELAEEIAVENSEGPDLSTNDKIIPRLVNNSVPLDILNSVDPENWTTADVAKFLTVNDCQPYCINFTHINGPMMLQLSKDEIIELLEMKVGPSLKIFDLIQQLKCKIKQPQCRLLGSFK